MLKHLLGICVLSLILAGCAGTPAASPTPPSDEPQAPEVPAAGSLEPLEWLEQIPFEPAGPEFPELVTTGLPDGFNAGEPSYFSGPHPDGFNVQRTDINYEKPVANQVYTEDQVTVEIFAFDIPEGRAFQLAELESEDYQWAFVQIAGSTVARYYNEGVDGRIWISGPYTIGLYSGLDVSERGPWLDDFAELYLQDFPAP